MQLRQFLQRRNPQPTSKLVQLPGELRLVILRYLLLFDTKLLNECRPRYPSRARQYDARRKAIIANICSGWAVARSCQSLLEDASHILYCENFLELDVATKCSQHPVALAIPNDYTDCEIHFLGSIGNFTLSSVRPFPVEPSASIATVKFYSKGTFQRTSGMRVGRWWADIIEHFQKLKIHIIIRKDTICPVTTICRLLKPYVKHKDLEILLQGAVAGEDSAPSRLIPLTECLQLASVTISNNEASSTLAYEFPRSRPNRDTCQECYSVFENIVQTLPQILNQSLTSVFKELLDEFSTAAMQENVAVYDTKLLTVLELSTKWRMQWLETEIASLEEQSKHDRSNTPLGTNRPRHALPDDYSFIHIRELEGNMNVLDNKDDFEVERGLSSEPGESKWPEDEDDDMQDL